MLLEPELFNEYFQTDVPPRKEPQDFRIKNQKQLTRSDSRVSTEENSLNYSANIKSTSKQVKRFLINESDEKMKSNNKQIRAIMSSKVREVRLKDFRKQVDILDLKTNLLDEFNENALFRQAGFLSDESRGAL